jgi:hypothetical protein
MAFANGRHGSAPVKDAAQLAEVLDLADHGNVIALAQFRDRVGAETAVGRPQPMKLEVAASVAGRLATVHEELLAVQKELDAERDRGSEDAGMYHVSLGFTLLDVDRVVRDLAREYGGE